MCISLKDFHEYELVIYQKFIRRLGMATVDSLSKDFEKSDTERELILDEILTRISERERDINAQVLVLVSSYCWLN